MSDNFNHFTEQSQWVMKSAQAYAKARRHSHVDAPHLLVAMLEQIGCLGSQVLHEAQVDLKFLKLRIERLPVRGYNGRPTLTMALEAVLSAAVASARDWQQPKIGTEHLLIALAGNDHPWVKAVFRHYHLTVERVKLLVIRLYYVQEGLEPPMIPPPEPFVARLLRPVAQVFGGRQATEPLPPIPPRTISEDDELAYLTRRLHQNPNNVNLLIARGMAYARQKNYSGAIADSTEVLRLSPGHSQALLFRGMMHESQREYQRALEDFSTVINQHSAKRYPRLVVVAPFLAPSYYGRGETYLMLGELDRARADLTQTIALNPNFVYAYAQRAYCDMLTRDFEPALSDLRRALTSEPKHALALGYRALVELEHGELAKAETYLQTALEDEEPHPYVLGCFAWVKLLQGNIDEALANAEKALATSDSQYLSLYVRGKVYAARGERDKAVTDFEMALKYYPNQEYPLHKPYIDEMKAYLAEG